MPYPLPISARLSLFYMSMFLVIGLQLPYWPVWLKARGLDVGEIGIVLAATFLVKLVANPLVGHLVDRRGDRRRPLLVLLAGSLGAYILFVPSSGFWGVLAVTVLTACFFTSIMPITENLTMLIAHQRGLDYGRIRLWGSLSFIVAAALGGRILVDLPVDAILWLLIAFLAVGAGVGLALPDVRTASGRTHAAPARDLLLDPLFLLFLVATGLLQLSHMIYYGFATLHWQAAGLSGTMIGWLWAIGVVAEVALFAFSNRVVAWCGPGRLLVIAGAAGALRWAVLAITTEPLPLMAAQTLHAATFGAMHLGAMHFITRAAPPGMSARAQALYSSMTIGLVAGLGMLAAGWLYQTLAGGAFLVMAGASAAGGAASLILLRRWSGGAIVLPGTAVRPTAPAET